MISGGGHSVQHRKCVVNCVDGGAFSKPVLGTDLAFQFDVGGPWSADNRARGEIACLLAPLELLGHFPVTQGMFVRACLPAFRRAIA